MRDGVLSPGADVQRRKRTEIFTPHRSDEESVLIEVVQCSVPQYPELRNALCDIDDKAESKRKRIQGNF